MDSRLHKGHIRTVDYLVFASSFDEFFDPLASPVVTGDRDSNSVKDYLELRGDQPVCASTKELPVKTPPMRALRKGGWVYHFPSKESSEVVPVMN
jgi:hypothetical protein